MKSKLLFLIFIIGITQLHAQVKVDPITHKNQEHFITTTIGYPVAGIYLIDAKKEPIMQLNADGSGMFQLENMRKKNMTWGIECTDEGIPIYKEGFNSASYTFWYKLKGTDEWIYTPFSILYNKKKMYIMGERSKDYEDYDDLNKSASN